MANTFKVINFAAEPNSAGTPFTMYTVASSTTTVVLGLILANINTTAVTASSEIIAVVILLVAGVTVCNALPRNTQYIVSVEAVAADSVKAVPEAVYALPDPGC